MSKVRTSGGYMPSSSREREQPRFTISEKDLPAIKDWRVGQKYTMTINAEMVSSSKDSDYDVPLGNNGKRKEIHEGRFKILSIDADPTKDLEKK